jgi:hypothetical protein
MQSPDWESEATAGRASGEKSIVLVPTSRLVLLGIT